MDSQIVDKYKNEIQEGLEILINECTDEELWQFVLETVQGVHLYKIRPDKRELKSSMYFYRTKVEIQIPPDHVYRCLQGLENRDQWDPLFKTGKSLGTLNNVELLHIFHSSGAVMVSDREFLFFEVKHKYSDGFSIILRFSIPSSDLNSHIDITPYPKTVEGIIHYSGCIILPSKESPNSTELSILHKVDLKGWVPNFWIVNSVQREILTSMEKLILFTSIQNRVYEVENENVRKIITIQAFIRNYLARKQKHFIRSVVVLQSAIRGFKVQQAKLSLLEQQEAYREKQRLRSTITLQACIRAFYVQKEYNYYRKNLILLQSCIRLYNASIVENNMAKKAKHRRKVFEEIVETETSYVNNLKVCQQFFLQPLRKKKVIDESYVITIFSNLEYIIGANGSLLKDLKTRVSNWKPSLKIGDIFLKQIPNFSSYVQYVANYNYALQTYERLQSNPAFVEFIQQCKTASKLPILDIFDLLIQPVQRLPRYELLLNDALKQTEIDSPDYSLLKQCFIKIQEINVQVNEHKRKIDSMVRISQLNLKGKSKPNLQQPGRLLVREGPLTQIDAKTKKEKRNYLFLFTDILMIAKPCDKKNIKLNYEHKVTFPLFRCSFYDSVEKGVIDDSVLCFRLIDRETNLCYTWKAPSWFEKNEWIKDFSKAIKSAPQDVTVQKQEIAVELP